MGAADSENPGFPKMIAKKYSSPTIRDSEISYTI